MGAPLPRMDLMDLDPAWMEVDLGALEENLETVRSLAGPAKIIAAVKGNGYGAGIVPVAETLAKANVHAIAMGSIKDSMSVRRAGIDVRIHMFPGVLADAVPQLVEN